MAEEETKEVKSNHHPADTNGDGVVDPVEHQMYLEFKRKELEDADAMRDAQRTMAWLAMGTTIVTIILLLTPIINVERMESASGFLNTFLVAQMGVVLGFMGATALTKTKAKE